MNRKILPALVALCLVSVLVLSSCVSAEERTILADASFSAEVDLTFLEIFTYSWSSDAPLTFTVTDPLGNEIPYQVNATSGSGTLPAVTAGTYTLTWYNDGTTPSHVSFDLSEPLNAAEKTISTLVWIGIIVCIVVVAVVAIVIIVVVMGDRKAPAQPGTAPPPMAPGALATGHCPSCGSPIDPSSMFCARCGARLR